MSNDTDSAMGNRYCRQKTLYETLRRNPDFFAKSEKWHFAIYDKDLEIKHQKMIEKAEGIRGQSTLTAYVDYDGMKTGMQVIDFYLINRLDGSHEYRGVFQIEAQYKTDKNIYHAAFQNRILFTKKNEREKEEQWKKIIKHLSNHKKWKDWKPDGRYILLEINEVIALLNDLHK